MLTKSEEISKELIRYLTNLSVDEWNLKVSDEWTIKDIISHLINWNLEASKVLPDVWKTKKNSLVFKCR